METTEERRDAKDSTPPSHTPSLQSGCYRRMAMAAIDATAAPPATTAQHGTPALFSVTLPIQAVSSATSELA